MITLIDFSLGKFGRSNNTNNNSSTVFPRNMVVAEICGEALCSYLIPPLHQVGGFGCLEIIIPVLHAALSEVTQILLLWW